MTAACVVCGKTFDRRHNQKTCGLECSRERVRQYHRDELAAATATVREIVEGRAPIPTDKAVLILAMLAVTRAETAFWNLQCTRDDPILGQLREFHGLLNSNELLRRRWKGWMRELHQALSELRLTELRYQREAAKKSGDIDELHRLSFRWGDAPEAKSAKNDDDIEK
jgi:hypothetical protein